MAQSKKTTEEHKVRAPFAEAKTHNFGLPKAKVGAKLTKSEKGTNPKRNRVYGYDNGAHGGRVPVQATMVLVPGAAESVVTRWVKANPKKTVQDAYDAKALTSRQVRRAFRAGAIRFQH